MVRFRANMATLVSRRSASASDALAADRPSCAVSSAAVAVLFTSPPRKAA
jgi:hypothetical protein